jgi:hypothetical protein
MESFILGPPKLSSAPFNLILTPHSSIFPAQGSGSLIQQSLLASLRRRPTLVLCGVRLMILPLGLKYKDEFFEFYERRGVQIRRIWKIFFRLSLPLIRQFRGFLGQIRRILEEYRVDRKGMKKGHILP